MKHGCWLTTALLSAVLVATGCSQQSVGPTTADFQKQRAQVVEKQKQMAALQLPTKKGKGVEGAAGMMGGSGDGFVYDPTGRRDPFRSFRARPREGSGLPRPRSGSSRGGCGTPSSPRAAPSA